MDAFLKRGKRKASPEPTPGAPTGSQDHDEPTEVKIAILASMHPSIEQETILDILLAHNGSVTQTSESLKDRPPLRKSNGTIGSQQSLKQYALREDGGSPQRNNKKKKLMSKKGSTLHLFDPVDVEEHTPCTIIHNFLPSPTADDLLRELLEESRTYEKITFKLFDNVVASPHTSSFYVESYDELHAQKTDYLYNGAKLDDVRRITPELLKVKPLVQEAVNDEIQKRIQTRYPNGQKLRFQSPKTWVPNSAFVNCYTGAQESVGWHSDSLTYLGPRAVIGSISLGVAREFRVRRIIPRDADNVPVEDTDAEGQIAIHLPHNSLLVMHAEMQEEWKHSISPALSIDPHPIAGNRRINITYRDYKAGMHPKMTPKCTCGVPCVMRVVQKKKENWGKYFWMCHAGNIPGKQGCTFFAWAEFDDDGNPVPSKSLPGKT